jgi:hypothetical protein
MKLEEFNALMEEAASCLDSHESKEYRGTDQDVWHDLVDQVRNTMFGQAVSEEEERDLLAKLKAKYEVPT